MRKQLTAAMVEKQAPPATGRLEIFDTIVPALALRVTAMGSRSYVVRGRVKGEPAPIRLTLGDAVVMRLTDARQAASEALRAMRAGIDPREAMKTEIRQARAEKALTFDALVDEWARLHLSRRRPRYAAEAVRAIRAGLPDLLKRPAAQIATTEAVNALDIILLAGKPVAAARTRTYARSCFSWALKRGKVPANPFAGLPIEPEKAERERVLSDHELCALWGATNRLGYPWSPYFKLLMLTLQRREEVAGMQWGELDLEQSMWSIPGSRMKNGRLHQLHLSVAAIDVIAAIPRMAGNDFVFTTTGRSHVSGYGKAKRHLDTAIASVTGSVPESWRLHDLRRTGVAHLAAMGFDSIVVDKLLAHQPGKLRGIAGIYQRYDFAKERAAALDAWAAHVTGADANSMVSLRAAQ
jgi:integrase